MKIYSSIYILTFFALPAFGKAIISNIKFSMPGGNQNVLSDHFHSAVPGDNELNYCDEYFKEDVLQIDFVNLSPKNPKSGDTLSIKASGRLLQEIKKGAYVKVIVKYGLIQLIATTADFCEQISNVDLSCPLEQGNLTIAKEVKLPSTIPPGPYTVIAEAYTDNDERILCLNSMIRF